MRCKVGDLAVIVKPSDDHQHLGKVVRVVLWHAELASWITEPELLLDNGISKIVWEDKSLLPIRDQPGEDETLTWAPVPTTIKEHA